jgi:hypothetical protein
VQVSESEKAPKGTDMFSTREIIRELIDYDYQTGYLKAKYTLQDLDDEDLIEGFVSLVETFGGETIKGENHRRWPKISLWMGVNGDVGADIDLYVDDRHGIITPPNQIHDFCEKVIAGRTAVQLEGSILHIGVFAKMPVPALQPWLSIAKDEPTWE